MKRLKIVLFLLLFPFAVINSQVLETGFVQSAYNADSVRAELEKAPYFTLFKDNYFIGGIPLNEKPTQANSDVKFQVSVFQRLTKSTLPFDTYLFLQYTQKVFWNILEHSLPIRDINFNPGLGLGHLIIHQNHYIGKAYLMLEHESNGKDSLVSRSWNRLSLGVAIELNKNWQVQFKGWIPFIDSRRNKDLVTYAGIAQFGGNYRASNKRFNAGLILTPRKDWGDFNTQVELSYKISKSENQYLFLQYYNGYAENLLEYKQFKSMLRIGFAIKPGDFSLF